MIKTSRFKAESAVDKDFKFTLFGKDQNNEKDKRTLDIGESSRCFNLITIDGTLKNGYGVKDLSMPQSENDLDLETPVAVRGNEVQTIWKLKWYNANTGKNCYYLFYFNDEKLICFDNLFATRLAPFIISNEFTSTPYATYYRKDGQDAILLSGEGSNLTVITGNETFKSEKAPKIICCASHYGKLFAITDTGRGKLVYNENPDVLAWSGEKTKNLDFSDDRGDLTKIISFNDYLYIFREFGITEISEYGNGDDFAISHIYQSTAVIEKNSIAQAGGKIFFLEGDKIKEFNGSSVKEVDVDCLKYLKGISQRNSFGACLDGKYYLACRGDFGDDKLVGCEGQEGGYKNNMLIVYDIEEKHVDILRGIDVNEILAFTNIFKSKVIFCFNNDKIGHIGELTGEGKVFGENLYGVWESGTTDFSMPGKIKRIKSFSIQSQGDCKVTIASEKENKTFKVKGSPNLQKIIANILGNQFSVKIEVDQPCKVDISEFTLMVSARQ